MANNFKLFYKELVLFMIAQICIILGLFSYASQIKALSELFSLFTIFTLIGAILMIIVASKLVFINKNYFYFFVTTMFYFFISLIATIGKESTEDGTVAIANGLEISSSILLSLIYIYFFLGTRDYFKDNNLANNINKSKAAITYIIVSTIVLMIMSFMMTIRGVKTNTILSAILRYGTLLLELVNYVFVLVILILMLIYINKKKKEGEINNEKEK